ncbi:MAG: hemolysin [Rickettsiales bacterium]|nr:hemolysin [Rickettsiales bacterium]
MEIFIIKCVLFIIFIIASAFFSSAETAFTAVNQIKLRSFIEKQNKKTKHLELLLTNPQRLITTILIGNNIANVSTASLATAVFFDFFAQFGFKNFAAIMSIVTGVVTFILLIFGEITPKTLAMKNPTTWAIRISPIIYIFHFILHPIVSLFSWFTNLSYKLFRIDKVRKSSNLTEEEIKQLIKMSEEEGVIEAKEKEMLHGVLNVFDKVVREIMTPRIDIISAEVKTNLSDVIYLITTKGHSRIPLYEDNLDNIIGFMYAKDLLNVDHQNNNINLRQFMRKAVFIPETTHIKDLFEQMKESKLHLAIVIDEHGGVSGLVTLEDIIEEIVGEIHDEYDKEEKPIKKLSKKHYLVDASVNIEYLSQHLNYTFPDEEDYDTVAGFILSQFGNFLKKGDVLKFEHFDFVINEIKKRRIISVDVIINTSRI